MTDDHNDPIEATRATAGQFGHPADGGLIEREAAAQIAERDCDWSAFGKSGIPEWDGGPDGIRDYRLGIRVGRAIAAAIRSLPAAQPTSDHSGDANKKVAALIERVEWACAPFHGDALGQLPVSDLRDLCAAARAAAQPVQRVKPLVWTKHPTSELWFCDTALGHYTIIGNRAKPSWNFDGPSEQTSQMAENVPSAVAMAVADYRRRVSALLEPSAQEEAHPDDLAVDRFAAAMKAKLAQKRAEGRGGWDGPLCDADILSRMLREHVEKGDPVDVGNFAMMLHQRGEQIAPAAQDGTEVTETDEYLLLKADVLSLRAENADLKAEVHEHREMLKGVGNERDVAVRQRDEALSLCREAQKRCDVLQAEAERLVPSLSAEVDKWYQRAVAERDRADAAEIERGTLKAEAERLRKELGAEQDSADEMADVLSKSGDGLMFDVDRLQAALDQHDALREAALRAEQKGDA